MEEPYIITYSNHFTFEGRKFAFRKKILFDITNVPHPIKIQVRDDGSKGIYVNSKWLLVTKMKELLINEPINIDVSHLQWYEQEQLNYVFNL